MAQTAYHTGASGTALSLPVRWHDTTCHALAQHTLHGTDRHSNAHIWSHRRGRGSQLWPQPLTHAHSGSECMVTVIESMKGSKTTFLAYSKWPCKQHNGKAVCTNDTNFHPDSTTLMMQSTKISSNPKIGDLLKTWKPYDLENPSEQVEIRTEKQTHGCTDSLPCTVGYLH